MTDPIAYIDGQLDVYDVMALIDAATDEAVTAFPEDEDVWTTEDETEYLATCPGYIDALNDEVTWDEHEIEDNGFENYPVDDSEEW